MIKMTSPNSGQKKEERTGQIKTPVRQYLRTHQKLQMTITKILILSQRFQMLSNGLRVWIFLLVQIKQTMQVKLKLRLIFHPELHTIDHPKITYIRTQYAVSKCKRIVFTLYRYIYYSVLVVRNYKLGYIQNLCIRSYFSGKVCDA